MWIFDFNERPSFSKISSLQVIYWSKYSSRLGKEKTVLTDERLKGFATLCMLCSTWDSWTFLFIAHDERGPLHMMSNMKWLLSLIYPACGTLVGIEHSWYSCSLDIQYLRNVESLWWCLYYYSWNRVRTYWYATLERMTIVSLSSTEVLHVMPLRLNLAFVRH